MLPENCMVCPNHDSHPTPHQMKRWSSEIVDISCELNHFLVVTEQPKESPCAPRPERCPINNEEQPWQIDTLVQGAISIEIMGIGSFGDDQPNLPLINRACYVLVVLTGKSFSGLATNFLELVQTDPKLRKATFRLKKS